VLVLAHIKRKYCELNQLEEVKKQMEYKDYFEIPTREQLRNRRNIQILECTDIELYKLYSETTEMLVRYSNTPSLADDATQDKALIEIELKNRGLKVPKPILSKSALVIIIVTTFLILYKIIL
jgi:hypothetical protein